MSVDTSIGDYKEQPAEELDGKKIVDNRLEAIKNEDQSRSFTDLMQNPSDETKNNLQEELDVKTEEPTNPVVSTVSQDIVYKVYIGTYTTSEQAKVAKEIIQESGSGLNPIVKCLGANNYTLQVGIFKNKLSAETLLDSIRRSNLPGRIIQEN